MISDGKLAISSKSERKQSQGGFVDSIDHVVTKTDISSSNGRVMLIDGTSIIYRAYYKLLGMHIAYLLILAYVFYLLCNIIKCFVYMLLLIVFKDGFRLEQTNLGNTVIFFFS